MGWKINHTGFNIVLSADVPELVRTELRNTAEDFLADNNLTMSNICSYIFHSGGPKVLQAMEASAGTTAERPRFLVEQPAAARQPVLRLRAHGDEGLHEEQPRVPGCYSMMGAMGPAFCSELLLLQW